MPIFKVSVTVSILAKNEHDARIGACQYIGGDLGIECLDVKQQEITDKQIAEKCSNGNEIDIYDYSMISNEEIESMLKEKILTIQGDNGKWYIQQGSDEENTIAEFDNLEQAEEYVKSKEDQS